MLAPLVRVSGGEARGARARETSGAGCGPASALARARGARFAALLREAAREAQPPPGNGAARGAPARPAHGAHPRDAQRDACAGGAIAEKKPTTGAREEDRAPAPPSAQAPAAPRASEPASAPELRVLVAALPVAVAAEATRLREGTPLSLSFGGSLDVELRLGGGGLAVVLRPEARLARACDAELPRLVAALEARGIVVGRASVRARSSAQAERQASR